MKNYPVEIFTICATESGVTWNFDIMMKRWEPWTWMSSKTWKKDWSRDCEEQDNYLDFGDMMTIFCCGRNTGYQFSSVGLEHGIVIVYIQNIHPYDHLPLPGSLAALALDVESVEKQGNLLGWFGCGCLKLLVLLCQHCIQRTQNVSHKANTKQSSSQVWCNNIWLGC